MTLLILPVIIIAAREALRAVPDSLRQAAFAVGATRWQTIRKVVLPNSISGILTGVILEIARFWSSLATLNERTGRYEIAGVVGPDEYHERYHRADDGGLRNNVQYCVVCHTEQRKYGRTESAIDAATLTFTPASNGTTSTTRLDDRAIGNLPNYIHKLHAGHVLAKQDYNYAGVEFNHIAFVKI